jgi:hypothetical protein
MKMSGIRKKQMPKKIDENNSYRHFKKITPDLFNRMANLPKEEAERILANVNYRISEQKEKIIRQAEDKKILTFEEYSLNYEHKYYDLWGGDGFLQYINAVMNSHADCFITRNENLLKKKEELKKKFGLRIASLEDIGKEIECNKDSKCV